MFRLFAKKCALCAERLDEGAAVERDGLAFCSEQHARGYLHRLRSRSKRNTQGDDCCR